MIHRPSLAEIHTQAQAAQAIGFAIGVFKVFVRDRKVSGTQRDAITMAIAGLERVLNRLSHPEREHDFGRREGA
jgi:hypothetical protein